MSKWNAALVAYEIALEAENSYDHAVWRPSYQTAQNGGPRIPDRIDAKMEGRVDIRCAAEEVLIATPAPDLSATVWKIEYARKRWEHFEDWPAAWWAAVMGDLRRQAA